MLHLLQRHPLPVQAFFRHCLVLTYAFPERVLVPLLPPGLALDGYRGLGFLAIAMVQTEGRRPVGVPAALGQDFFLTGYRIFARFRTAAGRTLRGLRILRSDADSPLMVVFGNLFTHYSYSLCRVRHRRTGRVLSIDVRTIGHIADLSLRARVDDVDKLPKGSPFEDMTQARRYAGPLPNTFDYEAETNSLVVIRATRGRWRPRPVLVESVRSAFLDGPGFAKGGGVLANAFIVEDVPYRWERGYRVPLG